MPTATPDDLQRVYAQLEQLKRSQAAAVQDYQRRIIEADQQGRFGDVLELQLQLNNLRAVSDKAIRLTEGQAAILFTRMSDPNPRRATIKAGLEAVRLLLLDDWLELGKTAESFDAEWPRVRAVILLCKTAELLSQS